MKLPILSFLFILSFNTSIAQELGLQRAVEVTAESIEKPFAQVKLIWSDDFDASKWTVYKKDDEGTFTFLSTVNSPDTSYVDENVRIGERYTYLIHKEDVTSVLGFGTVTTGVRSKAKHSHGTILVIVEEKLYDAISSTIDQYFNDLKMEGWRVIVHQTSSTATHFDLKAQIKDYHTKSDSTLSTVVLVGDLAIPYSGFIAPDGHTADHLGAWPADVYYGDLDGTWTDKQIDTETPERPENDNIPGDGKFDQSVIPSDVELMLGRIYLERFDAFESNRFKLYRRYFERNHEFRSSNYRFGNQAIINDDFIDLPEGFAGIGHRSFASAVGRENVSNGRLLDLARDTSYLLAYGCGNGDYFRAGVKLRNQKGKKIDSFQVSETSDYFEYNINCGINILFGSYFGDWDSDDNLLRAPLAGNSPALATLWAGRPVWHLDELNNGLPIGYSVRTSQNSDIHLFDYIENINLTYERLIHVSLMGDPTIHLQYEKGISNLKVAAGPGRKTADLTWTPSTEAEGYYVYRRDSVKDIYELLTQVPITENFFTDSFPKEGTNEYMVRASHMHLSPSGSFEMLTPGSTEKVTGIMGLGKSIENHEQDISVFPNPTSGQITISSSSPVQSVQIIDIKGRVLQEHSGFVNQKNLNTEDLKPGIYLLKAVTRSSTEFVKFQVY